MKCIWILFALVVILASTQYSEAVPAPVGAGGLGSLTDTIDLASLAKELTRLLDNVQAALEKLAKLCSTNEGSDASE